MAVFTLSAAQSYVDGAVEAESIDADPPDCYLPDAATIARECRKIRESWSPEVRAARRVGRVGVRLYAYSLTRKQGRTVTVDVAGTPR
jgi:hypothetical protein